MRNTVASIDKIHIIVSDIANPLIGDINEYERFVNVFTQKLPTRPKDHGK